tara:strand:+ start:412 stop:1044 length:633 start_codon:yes stop_codon:yes gene_type:complete
MTDLINPYITTWPDFNPLLNIGVMASGEGSNFKSLVESTKDGRLKGNISTLIVNNPECGALDKAKSLGVNYKIIDHRKYSSREDLDLDIIAQLKCMDVEIVVLAGWMRLVTTKLISNYKDRIINIHPSLLPSFKGLNSVQKSIDYEVKITGCSAHLVEKEVDSGSIIIQAAVPVDRSDTKDDLIIKIHKNEHIILPMAVAMVGERIRGLQ